MHTDCWIGDADTHYSNNWRTMEKKLQISKCFFRVLLSKKEKQLSLNSKLFRTDWWFR
jgi:hypothetical protein